MFDLATMTVAAQEAAIARIDAVSRMRALSRAESDQLAELLRRQDKREQKRRERLPALLAKAETRLAQLAGGFGGSERLAA